MVSICGGIVDNIRGVNVLQFAQAARTGADLVYSGPRASIATFGNNSIYVT
jgi:hypothetical protein